MTTEQALRGCTCKWGVAVAIQANQNVPVRLESDLMFDIQGWDIVFLILAVLGVVVALGAWWWAHRRSQRRIGFEVSGNVVVKGRPQEGITILYDTGAGGVAVPRVTKSIVLLKNFGGTPIASEDIRGDPVTFTFDGDRAIGDLTEHVVGSKPHVEARAEVESESPLRVTIGFNYLNPGDWLQFELLHTGETIEPVELEANVFGATRGIERGTQGPLRRLLAENQRWAVFATGILSAIVAVLLTTLPGVLEADRPPMTIQLAGPDDHVTEVQLLAGEGPMETRHELSEGSYLIEVYREGETRPCGDQAFVLLEPQSVSITVNESCQLAVSVPESGTLEP